MTPLGRAVAVGVASTAVASLVSAGAQWPIILVSVCSTAMLAWGGER